MAQQLIPPVPIGEEFDSTPVSQWMESVRKYINGPIYTSSTVNPTTTDIPSGTWTMWKNTSSGELRFWANDGGVLKSVLLS